MNGVILAGCKGDGISDDGEAFQRALDGKERAIHVPEGLYLIGRPLKIRSGTKLSLHPQAYVMLADGVARTTDDYLLSNADPENGDADISIEGGTWDGNNRRNARPFGLFDEGCSGALFHFRNVRGLQLRNLHFRNAEAYHARLTHVSGFHIEGIRFSSDRVRPNNDGIHLGGNCEDGLIRDIKGLHPGVTGDDMVALNADDALGRTEVRGMTNGPIRDILIEDIEAEGCHSFVRLLSVWSTISDVTIRRVRGSCEVAALNCDAARGCRVPVFDESAPPYPNGVGLLKNITASDFQVAKSVDNGIPLLRLETRMENFSVSDFHEVDPAAKASPVLRLQHVDLPRFVLNGEERMLKFGEGFSSSVRNIQNLLINP